MGKLYVLASVPKQGKTTTVLLLEKYFRSKGLKVACLHPTTKKQWDVGLYLKNNCHLYTIPLEASKGRKEFEKWLPAGYDVYLFELTYPQTSPTTIAYISLFDDVNEVMSYEFKDVWKDYVKEKCPNCGIPFWDDFYNRKVKRVITKTPEVLDEPCIDNELHNVDELVYNEVEGRLVLPRSNKKAIAVGAFPAEFQHVFDLKWYGYNYKSFFERFREEDYDIAIIGACTNDKMKFRFKPKKLVLCYHPPVYIGGLEKYAYDVKTDLRRIYNKIKTEPIGSELGEKSCFYFSMNNRYWITEVYTELDLISTLDGFDNIVICNGWIHPLYLIREGYLEV